jgi:valyl-tRNA synthetase
VAALSSRIPTLLVTGFDIIFFWVARMMMMGLRFRGDVPFRDVYIHGLVRDPTGQKMSKSKGNVIDPLAILDTCGADALRIALAAFAAMGRDVKLSPQRIEGYRNFANKLWNAARFVLMNLEEAGPGAAAVADALERGVAPADATLPDRWILSRLERTTAAVGEALDAYRFNDAASALYQFAWHELCDWYLEIAKPQLAGAGADRTRGMLLFVLERLLRLLHPFMPFLTEEVWQAVTAEGWGGARETRFAASIMVARWPAAVPALADDTAETEMARLIDVVRTVRNLRAEYNVAPSRPVEARIFAADAGVRARLADVLPLVAALARVEPVTLVDRPERPRDAAVETAGGVELAIPLTGLIDDLAAEASRIAREVEKVERELAGVETKLANPQFAERAPDDVKAEVEEKGTQLRGRRDVLRRSLERLRAVAT